MLDIKSFVFLGMMLQGRGKPFLTGQLWGPAWGLEKALGLKDEKGNWCHPVRDGLLLPIAGTALNILSISYRFDSQ